MKLALFTTILFSQICIASEYCATPESVGAVLFTDIAAIPKEYKKHHSLVASDLKSSNETPGSFFVEIEEKDGEVNFELWHKSAFLPENCGSIGNPGGLNRTIVIKKGKIIGRFGWQ